MTERERPEWYTEEEWAERLRGEAAAESSKPGALVRGKSNGASNGDLNFICGVEGQILRGHPDNIRIALHGLGIVIRQNDFTSTPEVFGVAGLIGELTDSAAIRMRFLIVETFSFLPPKALFEDVITDIAHQNRFHPVREWIDRIQWDGRPRIDDWLVSYGGASDTAFNRAVGRVFLIAGVRRVRRPGCKFDTLLVLEGPQGRNKSQAAEVLAGKRRWFTDGLSLDADPKVVIEQTKGSWVIEFAELTGMHTRDLERIKAFLSRNVDKARAAYGRRAESVPRQFIGIGTTNDREYMRKDERRLWPIMIERFDVDSLRRDVEQLWAEAAHYEGENEEITLQEDLWSAASLARGERMIADPFEEALARRLIEGPGWVSSADPWDILDVPIERRPMKARQMGEAMAALEFRRKQITKKDDLRGRVGQFYYERGKQSDDMSRRLYT